MNIEEVFFHDGDDEHDKGWYFIIPLTDTWRGPYLTKSDALKAHAAWLKASQAEPDESSGSSFGP